MGISPVASARQLLPPDNAMRISCEPRQRPHAEPTMCLPAASRGNGLLDCCIRSLSGAAGWTWRADSESTGHGAVFEAAPVDLGGRISYRVAEVICSEYGVTAELMAPPCSRADHRYMPVYSTATSKLRGAAGYTTSRKVTGGRSAKIARIASLSRSTMTRRPPSTYPSTRTSAI
jgi:hypothetical protein